MNPLSVPHSETRSDQSSERVRGMLSFAACAMLWSTAGIFIKILPWNAPLIAGVRSLIAGIFLLAWIGKPRFHWSFAQVAAAVLNTATMCLFVYANKTTTSANAILLQYSAPVITAVAGALILRERPRAEEVVAFLFVMIGMGIFFMDSLGGGMLLGNLAAAATGLTFGLYFVFMRMQKDGSPLESNLLSQWLTALVMLPIAVFLPMPAITTGSVLAILALGVLQIGLAAVFFAYGIKRVTAVQGVLVALIEPFFNPFWVFLFMGERPSSAAIVGGSIIVVAVTAASVIGARRAARAAS
jgi:drug/metabolite transporter (DMT)-like permease